MAEHPALRALRVRRSRIDAVRAAALLRPLAARATRYPAACNLAELDLSHCLLGDSGAMAVARLAVLMPSLTTIVLVNNRVRCGPSQSAFSREC